VTLEARRSAVPTRSRRSCRSSRWRSSASAPPRRPPGSPAAGRPGQFASANGMVEAPLESAEVAEQADASVSKTDVRKDVRVRLPLSAPRRYRTIRERIRLQTPIDPPNSTEIELSPRRRVILLAARLGEQAVVDWCRGLLNGAVAYNDRRRPSITWLGGRHAAGELRRGGVEDRGQDHWPRVWAARGLLYVWRPDAAASVLAGLHDPAWRVREMCAKAVRRHGIRAAEPILARLLDDPVPRVRSAVEAALTESGRSQG
jgi:hypothetical protein